MNTSKPAVLICMAATVAFTLSACGDGSERRSSDEQGLRVYRSYCLSCHQADGSGISSMYPPLQQTEWIEGDSGRLIRLILHGIAGPMEVDGERYNNVMPPHRHLTDEQIAAVLSFVRQNFGNDADAVSPEEVRAVRDVSSRRGPWRADELAGETGIPPVTD